MHSLSFDGLTRLYEQTRTFDPACFAAALDWLAGRFPPAQFPSILEPGVGTGRIALPLLSRGYEVTGSDISDEMLSRCAAQSRDAGAVCLRCLRADAIALPFPPQTFDLCFAVHLFYFISDWRQALREMLRVLRPGGALVLLHTGFGAEVPDLNARYRDLALNSGYTFPVYGVQSTAEVARYAETLGCSAEFAAEPSWEWVTRISCRQALNYLEARAYSFTKEVPDAVHRVVVSELQREAVRLPGGDETIIEVPNRLSIVIIRPQSMNETSTNAPL